MKWFRKPVKIDNAHGIYINNPPATHITVEAAHKSIIALISADASDIVKTRALDALVRIIATSHTYTISGCDIRVGN